MIHKALCTGIGRQGAAALAAFGVGTALIALGGPAQGAGMKVASYEEGPASVVSELISELRSSGALSVAVFDFETPDGESVILGSWFADQVVARLAAITDRPKLVERKHLDLAVREQSLLATGLIDSTSAVRIGAMRGADTVVAGDIQVGKQMILVEARAFSAESSEIIGTASVRFSRDSVPATLLAPQSDRRAQERYRARAASRLQSSWQVEALRVDVLTVRRSVDRKQATVELRLVNTSDSDIAVGIRKIAFGRCSINLRDEQGTSHLPIGDDRGSGNLHCVTKSAGPEDFTLLPPGTTPVGMTFQAKQDSRIEGRRFQMTISFVLLTEDGHIHYPAGFENLVLED